MSRQVLVIGESGTGKSTSIRNLDNKETFIIKVSNKPLPFRGGERKYSNKTGDDAFINMANLKKEDPSDRYNELLSLINAVNLRRPEIKNLVIDDFQYLMVDEFFSKAQEKGFDKFAIMSANMWKVIHKIEVLRDDLNIILLCHNDINEKGNSVMKVMGKAIKEKYGVEGKFTLVLHTHVEDGSYKFLTQYRKVEGTTMQAKTPMGMFDDDMIDNDLKYVIDEMNKYYDEEFADDTVDLK